MACSADSMLSSQEGLIVFGSVMLEVGSLSVDTDVNTSVFAGRRYLLRK